MTSTATTKPERCLHDPRFGGVFGAVNGCLACQCEEYARLLQVEKGKLRSACKAIAGMTADPRQTQIAMDILEESET